MIHEFYDMDKQEKIRYVSESSNASTSGYSTMSSNHHMLAGRNGSPTTSMLSISPSNSPVTTTLQNEFSNLNLPSTNSPLQYNSPQYGHQLQMRNISRNDTSVLKELPPSNIMFMDHHYYTSGQDSMEYGEPQFYTTADANEQRANNGFYSQQNYEYPATLQIMEQPVEKFRFRYKSEMHGTHGSLNGANSKRMPKTFPEVKLCGYSGHAVIRCSLFQTNIDSPHSHQLVVRKDERDVCDPHDLHVSQEIGYIAQFINMGIIHTAKKYIFEELLKKKQERLVFQMGRRELSTRQLQELHKETEKESKDMNLNQVRLCFEAFKIENNIWTPIAVPVYTNAINNRKSAQTGELRIVRLSMVSGSVKGNDELILLVEKVSKKNIKVRFFEQNDENETVWEAYAKFRESDVHHQYAIVCQTPAYEDKDVEHNVNVSIELVRPSDDERSFPPMPFRYKPRDAIASRKRRRTCSNATSSSTGSRASSLELPKPVEEQAANLAMGMPMSGLTFQQIDPYKVTTISEEFNKEQLINSQSFQDAILPNSEELSKICQQFDFKFPELEDLNTSGMDELQKDGATSSISVLNIKKEDEDTHELSNPLATATPTSMPIVASTSVGNPLQRIFRIYVNVRNKQILKQNFNADVLTEGAKQIEDIYLEYADKNFNGDTILHDIINSKNDNPRLAMRFFVMLKFFKLEASIMNLVNASNESALHYACLHDRAHYIRPLLSHGCDPNIQDRNDNTALHLAVKENHLYCIECILKMSDIKLDLTLMNDQSLTPLHLAIQQNNYVVAKKLIKYDRNSINVCNTKNGNNALHMAVLQQNIELIVLIIDAQNVEDILITRNAAGCTPLELAKQLNSKIDFQIVQLLEPLYKDIEVEIEDMVKIKEEIESSSTDEDEESDVIETMDVQDEFIKIKEEIINDEDYTGNIDCMDSSSYSDIKTIDTHYLASILNDERKFDALVKLLNQKSGNTYKWKLLAEQSKMQHLVFLWSSAKAMLNYIKSNSSNSEYNSFAKALSDIELDVLEAMQFD